MADPQRDLVLKVHEAMQNAPHDGKDYRQARAAIAAVSAERAATDAFLLAFLRHVEIEVLPCEYIDAAVAPNGIAERASELVRLLDVGRDGAASRSTAEHFDFGGPGPALLRWRRDLDDK